MKGDKQSTMTSSIEKSQTALFCFMKGVWDYDSKNMLSFFKAKQKKRVFFFILS